MFKVEKTLDKLTAVSIS